MGLSQDKYKQLEELINKSADWKFLLSEQLYHIEDVFGEAIPTVGSYFAKKNISLVDLARLWLDDVSATFEVEQITNLFISNLTCIVAVDKLVSVVRKACSNYKSKNNNNIFSDISKFWIDIERPINNRAFSCAILAAGKPKPVLRIGFGLSDESKCKYLDRTAVGIIQDGDWKPVGRFVKKMTKFTTKFIYEILDNYF